MSETFTVKVYRRLGNLELTQQFDPQDTVFDVSMNI